MREGGRVEREGEVGGKESEKKAKRERKGGRENVRILGDC